MSQILERRKFHSQSTSALGFLFDEENDEKLTILGEMFNMKKLKRVRNFHLHIFMRKLIS